jgi:predicted lipoprotein with Yx(FWY)xxD motif
MRKSFAFLALPAIVLALAACGSSKSSSSTTSSAAAPASSTASPYGSSTPSSASSTSAAAPTTAVKISAEMIPGLGPVLVNPAGRALYTFAPDKAKKVTCVGGCASVWPPVMLAAGAKAVGSGGVKASLLGSDPDPSGGKVLTYAGWPLYLYVGDTAPGTHAGQALNLNGGLWYVISPSGKVITKK